MVDLTVPVSRACLIGWGIELAARSLFEKRDAPKMRSFSARSRPALAAELGVEQVAVLRPDEREMGGRSARWQKLCAAVQHAEKGDLAPAEFERLLWLLHWLGFNELVCQLAEKRTWRADNEVERRLCYTATLALYVVEFECSGIWNGRSFDYLAHEFSLGSVERAHCSYHLVQIAGRHRRDAAEVRVTLARHRADCEAAAQAADPFISGQLWSRFWRVAAFLPQFEGDFASMHAQMDRCLAALEAIPIDDDEQGLVVDELRWPHLESSIKAYRASGEFDKAVEVAHRLVALTPMQAMAYVHLGESLADVGQDREAIVAFRHAVALGPAGTAQGLSYLGQYAAADGDHQAAWEFFDRALLLDPSSLDLADAIGALPDVPDGYKQFVAQRAAAVRAGWRDRRFHNRYRRPELSDLATARAG